LTDKILAEGIDELPKRNRILDHLHSCLGKLSDFNQMLVKTPYQKNISIAELAKRLEKKPDALYKKASRLRRALAECVEQKLLSET
jgi:DNA-directed RNA polymerase specialized sigma24 family protein